METLSPTEITVVQINALGIVTHETRVIENEETGEREVWKRKLKSPKLKLDVHIRFVCEGAHLYDAFACKKGKKYVVIKMYDEGDKRICVAKNASVEFDGFYAPQKLILVGCYAPKSSLKVPAHMAPVPFKPEEQKEVDAKEDMAFLIQKLSLDPLENNAGNAVTYIPHGIKDTEPEAIAFCQTGKTFTSKDCWAITGSMPEFIYKPISKK